MAMTTGYSSQQSLGEILDQDTASTRKNAKLFDTQDSTCARKTLQTLQPSSTGNRLVGKHGPVQQKSVKPPKKKNMIKQYCKPIEVFSDSSPEASANPEQEALKLMGTDLVPESYWKMLAEERRAALDDSLHENEQLHKEIDELKDENVMLKELAGQADYLASILQTAIESSSDDEDQQTVADGTTVSDAKVEAFLSSYDVISLTDENVAEIVSLDEKPNEFRSAENSSNVVDAKGDSQSFMKSAQHSAEENELKKSDESSKPVFKFDESPSMPNTVYKFVGSPITPIANSTPENSPATEKSVPDSLTSTEESNYS